MSGFHISGQVNQRMSFRATCGIFTLDEEAFANQIEAVKIMIVQTSALQVTTMVSFC